MTKVDCGVRRVIDSDTMDTQFDLPFGLTKRATVRLLCIDTAEVHEVDHDSGEFNRATRHIRNSLNGDSKRLRRADNIRFGRGSVRRASTAAGWWNSITTLATV